jgi:hypothetical protein
MFAIDLSALPEEVVAYGMDQFRDRLLDERFDEAAEQFQANEEYLLDYDDDRMVFLGTVVTNVLESALIEKINDIEREVLTGEREDYNIGDVEFMREGVHAAFESVVPSA